MTTVLRYAMGYSSEATVKVPVGSAMLAVVYGAEIELWVLGDSEAVLVRQQFLMLLAGEEMPAKYVDDAVFLGTIHLPHMGTCFVFNCGEIVEDPE